MDKAGKGHTRMVEEGSQAARAERNELKSEGARAEAPWARAKHNAPGGGCATKHFPLREHSNTYTLPDPLPSSPPAPSLVMSSPPPPRSTQRVPRARTNTRRDDSPRSADATCCMLKGASPRTTPTCAEIAECEAATNSLLRSTARAAARDTTWRRAWSPAAGVIRCDKV